MASSGSEGHGGSRPSAAPMLIIVTGMSGAGRTTAINALEDLGFEALNNFPLSLVDRLVEPAGTGARPIAIGVETRTRGFSARALTDLVGRLRQRDRVRAVLVFLDCADEALASRFNQTRRRHPLAPGETVAAGIARERDILAEVRGRADIVLDTTALSPHALRTEIESLFVQQIRAGLAVSVQSFSYKRGAPHDADMVLDCRFLRNPYWQEALRELDGREPPIQAFVREDPAFGPFFEKLCEMLMMLLPAYMGEGRAYFCVALGCTGGRHRSVAVGEMLTARLGEAGWPVSVRHRELERGPAARGSEE